MRYRNAGNRALVDLIDIPPGRALDCGCGAGDNARLLTQRGWRVTGVTIDPAEGAAAAAHCAAVVLADLTAGLPFAAGEGTPAGDPAPGAAAGPFDLVVLSHVLEHLADPAALLAEARRVLAPGGRIAVALPNVLHYRQRAEFLRGRFEYTETGLMDATHLRFFTVTSARRLVESAGLAIRAQRATGGLPWWRLRDVLPADVLDRADRWALRHRPDLFAGQACFVASPVGPVRVPAQGSGQRRPARPRVPARGAAGTGAPGADPSSAGGR
ncbi:MAG: class I SAM-dependent methyltransferase [Frankia sp.]|nr:class I SAM-dependent methyltransferase [Frankia sp.]